MAAWLRALLDDHHTHIAAEPRARAHLGLHEEKGVA